MLLEEFLSPRPAWVVQAHADDAQVDPGVPVARTMLARQDKQSLRAAPVGTEANNAFSNSPSRAPMTGTANLRPCSL